MLAGNHRPPETRVIDSHEIEQLISPVGKFLQKQQSAGLGHGFNDQNTGHDRLSRKMALEETFVDAYVFDSHNALESLHFQDGVDHQERITMWQDFLDLISVQNHQLLNSGERPRDTQKAIKAL